jgi:hypothetical protein
VERTKCELFWLDCPSLADELVGGEAVKGLQPPGEVVGGNEVDEMPKELVVGFAVISPSGRVLDGAVHSLGLAVIRYEIRRRLCARLFPKGRRRYGEPIRTRAPGARRCGQAADRQWAESPSSLHGRPLRLSRMRPERGSVDVVSPASSRFEQTETE